MGWMKPCKLNIPSRYLVPKGDDKMQLLRFTRLEIIDEHDLCRHHTTAEHQQAVLYSKSKILNLIEKVRNHVHWQAKCLQPGDLCSFLRSEISFVKPMNEKLVTCFEKWMKLPMPDESTLYEKTLYLSTVHCETIKMICQTIGNYRIQIFVDEKINSLGRKLLYCL